MYTRNFTMRQHKTCLNKCYSSLIYVTYLPHINDFLVQFHYLYKFVLINSCRMAHFDMEQDSMGSIRILDGLYACITQASRWAPTYCPLAMICHIISRITSHRLIGFDKALVCTISGNKLVCKRLNLSWT